MPNAHVRVKAINYSNEGDLVFDPFAGSGSTLIAAKNLRRFGKGIELSVQFIKLYKQRTNNLNLFDDHEYEPELTIAVPQFVQVYRRELSSANNHISTLLGHPQSKVNS